MQVARYEDIRGTLRTGAVVLFANDDAVHRVIRGVSTRMSDGASGSPWAHVGMVLRDDLHGQVLLWESRGAKWRGAPWRSEPIGGVQVSDLSGRLADYPGCVAVRNIEGPALLAHGEQVLAAARRQLEGRPYEQHPLELLRSALDKIGVDLGDPANGTASLFCSELLATLYQRLGWLLAPPHGLAASEYVPADFAQANSRRLDLRGVKLGDEVLVCGTAERLAELAPPAPKAKAKGKGKGGRGTSAPPPKALKVEEPEEPPAPPEEPPTEPSPGQEA